ncbi:MAG: ParA family protein [Magnetococcales bacterium]|nr:ParA family protein [Nitrospirota bacterium]
MPAKIISFINFKGGVGKTSNTVNIAGELALRGHRVLVIDMDPQANASVWLMDENSFFNMCNDKSKKTLLHLFLTGKSKFDIRHAIIPRVCSKNNVELNNLDLLSSDYRMITLDLQLNNDLMYRLKHNLFAYNTKDKRILLKKQGKFYSAVTRHGFLLSQE